VEAVKRKRKRQSRVVLPWEKSFLWQWLEFAETFGEGCEALAGLRVQW